MKIALVEVIPERYSMTMNLVPPLGLGYIAAFLESRGHDVSIIEGINYNGVLSRALDMIVSEKPDVVGFTATSPARLRAIELIMAVKGKTGAFTVAGGPHFSSTGRQALENIPELDVVVKGEGEYTLADLIEAIQENKNLSNIEGIFFRDNEKIIETKDRSIAVDLDHIPWPAYHLFRLKKYRSKLEGTNFPAIGVISSRGCPNDCIFCANRVMRKGALRLRNPKDFVDELEFLRQKYGYGAFDFWDDTLTMSRSHITNICEEILQRDMRISWFARARVNTVDRKVLELMKRAGCSAIAYGVESGSERVLKTINKGILLSEAEDAINLSSEVGFRISAYFVVSFPGENLADIDMTFSFIRKFKKFRNVFSYYCFAIIYPGTDLENIAKTQGVLPADFSWYKPYTFEKNKIVGNDPSLPCFENKYLKLEEIKAHILKLESPLAIFKKASRRIFRVRSFAEFKRITHFLFNYGIK